MDFAKSARWCSPAFRTFGLSMVAVACFGADPSHARQATSPPTPTSPAATYEDYCGKSRMEKQALLRTLTSEQRAMLWRTQIERWRDANQARLNAGQQSLLREFHAIIPMAVARPRTPDTAAKLEALEGRLSAAFSEDDLKAMDNYGPCIPK